LPFVNASASGVADPPTVAATKAVVANCVELFPGAAVGAVGVPVNDGDAIVARSNISAVFVVILAVFDIILVSNEFSAFVALVISAVILAVFAAIEFVLLVILKVLAVIAFVLLVILTVFDVILVSNEFSAFVALVISAVILDVLAAIAIVLLVILEVFDVILVSNEFSAFVALVISAVILEVLESIAFVLLVILKVLDAINVGNVDIVEELTPPTLFTVGKLAVPPKSFVSFNIPFTLEVASGAPEPPTSAATKAVVANCVVLVPGEAVGAVGVPVNDGDAIVARNNISAALAVILAVFEVIAIVLLVILAVFEVINVGNDAIVEELKPPTLATVVEKVPNPAPVTSPVNEIN